MNYFSRTGPVLATFALTLALVNCQSDPSASQANSVAPQGEASTRPQSAAPSEGEEKNRPEVVVYSGRSEGLVGPLLKRFEEETGIKVKTRFDKSTQALANRLAIEGDQTSGDVFFAQDSGYLGALAKKGLLAKLPEEILNRVRREWRDKSGYWVASSGRARVLVYSPERVKADALPQTLEELADPKWQGRVGWAPSNSSYQAHVSALRATWGEERTRTWLGKMQSLEPKIYPKNSPQVKAVSNGEIDVGWVNHYYLHKLRAANRDLKAANYSFPTKADAGNLLMLSGVAITKASRHPEQARRLVAFLLSDEAQNYFAQEVYEYPTVAGVKTHPDVPDQGEAWATVDQQALADVAGTVKLLREMKIQ